jgi:hypothetical protein
MDAAAEITRLIIERYFPNKEIDIKILPYSVILIKKSERDHVLVFAADHLIYDALSDQVLKTNIEAAYHGTTAPGAPGTAGGSGYDEYVKQINKGPQRVSEEEIIETFALEEFSQAMAKVRRVFEAKRNDRLVNHTIIIPIKETALPFDDKMPLETSLRIYADLSKAFFHIEKIPLLFFAYGRKYQDRQFFDTIGEFIDMVPILVDTANNSLAKIQEKIAFAAAHNINFVSTLMNPALAAKWQRVTGLLAPDGEGYNRNLLRFNFTGQTGKFTLHQGKETAQNPEAREQLTDNRSELDGITLMAGYNKEFLKIDLGFNMEVDEAELRGIIRRGTEKQVALGQAIFQVQ